ncbi:hypothetical protein [Capnocytophaga stomatis]|uniref:Uncharacterized protein n=1 Tax=Capnocytophaga stomatis TaxID=1848904 RepID=A0ABW8QDQ1_9FLAO|nr:hypothetical protein [Capnocytophaga stomatis]
MEKFIDYIQTLAPIPSVPNCLYFNDEDVCYGEYCELEFNQE